MIYCCSKLPSYSKQHLLTPGIKSGNAALPPDLDQLEPLASDAVSHKDPAKIEGPNLNFTISVSRNKVFVTGHHGKTSSTRIATIGGIVQHNGHAYIFTAGHPLDKTSRSGLPRKPKVIHEEWEIDSDSDGDGDSDMEITYTTKSSWKLWAELVTHLWMLDLKRGVARTTGLRIRTRQGVSNSQMPQTQSKSNSLINHLRHKPRASG
jgi:hypothetical protein